MTRRFSLASRRYAAALAVLCLVYVSVGPRALAAPQTQAGGVTVTPAKVQLTLQKGQPSTISPVTLRNNSGERVRFAVEFRAVTLTAKGALVPTTKLSGELGAALKADVDDVMIQPGELAVLNVQLNDSPSLAPGGQYASMFIQQVAEGDTGLAITPAVSVNIFALKESGAIRSLDGTSIDSDGSVFYLPTTVRVGFAAGGNVAVTPRGVVIVKDSKGNELSRGVINSESLITQPGRELRLQTQMQKYTSSWLPGRYKVEVVYRYDGTDETKIISESFWHVPPQTLFVVFAVVLLVAVLVWQSHRILVGVKRLIPKRKIVKKEVQKLAPRPKIVMDIASPKPGPRHPK